MTNLARYDLVATDSGGNVIAGASVEVRREIPGQPLVALYSDLEGTTAIGNPLTTDADGSCGFHCVGGFFKITVTSGSSTRTRRYVAIGTAQGTDVALSSSETYYVNASTGDDANNGLNSSTPFQTLAAAAAAIAQINTGGNDITVSIEGAFTAGAAFARPVGGGTINVLATGPSSITAAAGHCLAAADGGRVVLDGANVTLSTLASDGTCLVAYGGGVLECEGMTFGAAGYGHIQAGFAATDATMGPGTIKITGDYTIAGGGVFHWHVPAAGSSISLPSTAYTVTLTGTPNFSAFFAGVTKGLIYNNGTPTFSGAATGMRFYAHNGGTIAVFASRSTLPGNVEGETPAGGNYVIDDNINFSGIGSLVLGNKTAIENNTNTLVNLNAAGAVTVAPPAGGTAFHVIGKDATSTAAVHIDTFGAAAFGAVARRADGTYASKSAVAAATQVLGFQAYAWDGAAHGQIGACGFFTSNAQTGSDHSSYFSIRTVPSGSTTVTEAMRVQPSGGVSIGSGAADPGVNNLKLQGSLFLGSFTVGTLPTGAAAGNTAYASNARVFNGAGTQEGAGVGTGGLVTYNGSAWKLAGTNTTVIA